MAGLSKIEEVAAILEIHTLKARYFRAVDTKDWDLLRSVFTPDAQLLFLERQREGTIDVDTFIRAVTPGLQNIVSIHHGHMPEIEILSADTARGIWAMEEEEFPEGEVAVRLGFCYLHGYGHYHEEYQRRDGRWLIHRLKLTRLRKTMVKPPQSFDPANRGAG